MGVNVGLILIDIVIEDNHRTIYYIICESIQLSTKPSNGCSIDDDTNAIRVGSRPTGTGQAPRKAVRRQGGGPPLV